MLEGRLSFEEYLKENDVSENTIASYKRDISFFEEYLRQMNFSDFNDVLPKDVKQYADYLISEGKSNATVTRNLAAVRAFYRFLLAKGVVMINPALNVKADKAEKKIPEILTVSEIKKLLNQPDTESFIGFRDKAMLELLYATGMRSSELLELKLKDINIEYSLILIRADESGRTVPYNEFAGRWIEEYISVVRQHFDKTESEYLFLNNNGKKMSRQGFWKILKAYAQKAGIEKQITPHTIRHSFAIHMLENGVSVKRLKEIMGHSDISSTQAYAQIIKKHFLDEYGIFHPRSASK